MKILAANYRYFLSGGPERYMFNVISSLERAGHEVIPFSINYSCNKQSPYSGYFVEPLGSKDEITFREQRLTPRALWRTILRLFYAPDVLDAITRLVTDVQPQIAYVLCYLRKLSPSLLVALKKAGLPIVVRLSDFAMICPQAHCLRSDAPCELCIHGNLLPSIRHRCIQRSFAASALNALATWYHQFRGYFDLVDVFVTTNDFMYRMMRTAGFSRDRLACVPTFVDFKLFSAKMNGPRDRRIAYVGRLDHLKGVHILLEAVDLIRQRRPNSGIEVRIIGAGNEKHSTKLKSQIEAKRMGQEVKMLGEMDASGIASELSRAMVTVVPSLWYENLPNTILESYACGTPVLASDIGSLSGCVQDGKTGYLFRPGDAPHLAERLEYCLDNPVRMAELSHNARRAAQTYYTPEKHIAALEELFSRLMRDR